jgi:hypothetical protein
MKNEDEQSQIETANMFLITTNSQVAQKAGTGIRGKRSASPRFLL